MADSDSGAGHHAHPHRRQALLLLARHADEGATAYCRDHLSPGRAPTSTPIVVLTEPSDGGEPPLPVDDARSGVVVSVGDAARSGGGTSGVPSTPSSPPETVVTEEDLGALGRAVDDYVATWAASGHEPIVCVDSLAGLSSRASIEAVHRFLFVLLHRVETAGGSAHVHADPRAYEEEILRTFFPLFDQVISFQDGGLPM